MSSWDPYLTSGESSKVGSTPVTSIRFSTTPSLRLQDSKLGVALGGKDDLVISAIGQADDVVLVSNDIHALQILLQLSLKYCEHHHVKLRADKTKLQVFSNKNSEAKANSATVENPIKIGDEVVSFTDEADHVGIIWSISGNLPHIIGRLSAHRKALLAVLPLGLARGHNGNPAASLRINKIYATPVLFSGMGSLVLSSNETNILEKYTKKTVQNLKKLMDKTPSCVVAFLDGALPGTALLHLKQFSIFGMISRKKGSRLYNLGTQVLTSGKPSLNSWFQQIRRLCLMYNLPHPISLLEDDMTKGRFDSLVRSRVVDYWERKLREEAAVLTSVPYFKPQFMSLSSPHPIWTSCGPSPFESRKAVVACRMISGKYLTDKLQRHWTQNREGLCLLPGCTPHSEGSLEHILLHCTALAQTRARLHQLAHTVAQESHLLGEIITSFLESDNYDLVMQFILDCSVIPAVITTTQVFGNHTRDRLLYLGRTWCYNIHRERMNQLGLFSFR